MFNLRFSSKVIIAFAAIYLIWGSTYLAIRFTIETIPPLLSGGLRFFLAGFILFSYSRFKKRDPAPELLHWRSAIIVGSFLLLGGNGCVVLAQRFIPSGLASIFIAMTPLWMVLVQWLWHKKKPAAGVLIGIAVGFFGIWLLMSPDLLRFDLRHIHLGGAFGLLFASLSWAIGSVYSRQARLPAAPLLATGMQMMAGGGMLILAGCLRGEINGLHPELFSLKSIAAFFYLLFVGSLVGFTAYIWLLKNVGIAKTSTYAFVNPVVAVFLGWSLGGEKLTWQTAIAAACVVGAVIIITLHQKEKVENSPT